MPRIWAIIAMSVGIAALLLQIELTVSARMALGYNLPNSLVRFFSFFTVQVNIVLVLVYAAFLFRPAWLDLFARPATRAVAAAAIALVMIFYYFFLSPTWIPNELWLIAGPVLHYVAPLAYLGWFALFMRSGTLGYGSIPKMLIYPGLYLAYVMVRGAITYEYPYPQLAANYIGYQQAALNSIWLLVGLTALMTVAITVDRLAPQNGRVS